MVDKLKMGNFTPRLHNTIKNKNNSQNSLSHQTENSHIFQVVSLNPANSSPLSKDRHYI